MTSSYDDFQYGQERGDEPTIRFEPDQGWDEEWDDEGWDDGPWDEDAYDDGEDYDGEGEPGDEIDPDLAAVVTRRRFLAGLAVSGAAGYTAFWAMGRDQELATVDPSTTTTTTRPRPRPQPTTTQAQPPTTDEPVEVVDPSLLVAAPVGERILVLVELEGGNDGPSTVVPYTSGTYYDLRPNMGIPADQVLVIDDEVGLNPNLGRLHGRQLAIVEGVGPVEGTLSHFEMVDRWEKGDLYGNSGLRTGFLGRVADALDDGSATIGLSVNGFTPRFNNVSASTLSLNNLNSLRVLTKDDWIYPSYRQAMTSFTGGPMTTTITESWRHLVEIGNALPNEMSGIDKESAMVREGGQLGRQLATAAEIVKADFGVRVVHARLGGFDTHKGHQYKHERLMQEIDVAIDGFLQAMADAGMAERVLVATSSEFGRRARENGNGLDHGAATSHLLFGPVIPGRYGEPSPLSDLDDRGNLKTTVPFDSYLGTLAQHWLGVEASSVLPTTPELLPVV